MVLIVLVSVVLFSSIANAQTQYYSPLREALVDFQSSWGVDIIYDATLVVGRWTVWNEPIHQNARDDLNNLLVGTGLVSYTLSSGTIGLRRAQARFGRISGIIRNAETNEPLLNSAVKLVDDPRGAASNAEGRFSIPNVKPGIVKLSITHVGFAPQEIEIVLQPGAHEFIDAALSIRAKILPPIIVEDRLMVEIPSLEQSNLLENTALQQIRGFGTADVTRSLAELSGVSVDEKSGDLFIQGGDRGDHRFLLDDSPIYDPVSVGILSGLSPFALGNVSIHKAGFAASQGSFLSGVIHAQSALKDSLGRRVFAHIDPLSFNGRLNLKLQRPHHRIQGSMMATHRRSVWSKGWSFLRSPNIDQLLLDWANPDTFLLRASIYPLKLIREDLYKYYIRRLSQVPPAAIPLVDFKDTHLAGQLIVGTRHLFSGSLYLGDNNLEGRHLLNSLVNEEDSTALEVDQSENIPRPDKYDWSNTSGQITWQYFPSNDVTLSTRIRRSSYHLNHSYAGLDRANARQVPFARLFIDLAPAEDGNSIREFGLKQNVNVSFPGGSLITSLEYVRSDHRFVVRDIFPQGIYHKRTSSTLAFSFEERLLPLPGLEIIAGTRLTYLSSHDQVYAEPRLSLDLKLRTNVYSAFVARIAGGIYRQYINQFDISTISPSTLFPSTRIWVPMDESIAPPKSYHLAGDLGIEFLTHWSFRFEGYYKDHPHLLRINYPVLWQPETDESVDEHTIDLTSLKQFVSSAKGFSYGAAFIMEHHSRWLRLHTRLERSISEREYAFRGEDIRMLAVPWNEPRQLHVHTDIRFSKAIEATARWRSIWGRMWGFRQAYYDYLGTDTDQALTFGDVDFRDPLSELHHLNTLHELDLGISYSRRIGARGPDFRVGLDMINVLNRTNQSDLFLDEVFPSGSGEPLENESPSELFIGDRHLIGRVFSLSLQLHW